MEMTEAHAANFNFNNAERGITCKLTKDLISPLHTSIKY